MKFTSWLNSFLHFVLCYQLCLCLIFSHFALPFKKAVFNFLHQGLNTEMCEIVEQIR